MKLSRLYQPRNPLFWLMVVLNLLSTALAWVARTYNLTPLAAGIVAIMGIGDCVFGIPLMFLLFRDEPKTRPKREADGARPEKQ